MPTNTAFDTVLAQYADRVLTCTCETPTPHTRPSGLIVCLNDGCGLMILPPVPPPEERP